MDIVERLRTTVDPNIWDYEFALKGERTKAADEIDRLRSILQEVLPRGSKCTCNADSGCKDAAIRAKIKSALGVSE